MQSVFHFKEKLVSKGKARQDEIRKLYNDMPVTLGKLILDRLFMCCVMNISHRKIEVHLE